MIIIRGVLWILAYIYPAYKFFKTMEMKKQQQLDYIDQLVFGGQYWILVVGLTACEQIAYMFIAWVPMLGEAKLAFLIYLWFHKSKGTTYVFESLARFYTKLQRMIIYSVLKFHEIIRAGDDKILPRISLFSPPTQSKLYKSLQSYLPKFRIIEVEESFTPLERLRRAAWVALAFSSGAVSFAILGAELRGDFKEWSCRQVEKVQFLEWIIKQCRKIHETADWCDAFVFWMAILPIYTSIGVAYNRLMPRLAFSYKIEPPPPKLPSSARWLFEGAFFLISLWLACYVKDSTKLLMAFCMCFHTIPVLNFWGALEIFDLLDCLVAMLFLGALFCCKYPEYVPYLVVAISMALPIMKHYYEDLKNQLMIKNVK